MDTSVGTSAPAPAEPVVTERRRFERLRGSWLFRRWATWFAIGSAGLMWGADVASLRELMLLLALVYAVTAAIGRREVTWAVLGVLFVMFLGATSQDRVDSDAILLAVAAGAIGLGLLRSRDRTSLLAQGAGVALFGGAALLAAESAPDAAVFVVAGGYFAHGAWDVVHWWRQQVVSRTYAEWCGVLDVLVGAMLIITTR